MKRSVDRLVINVGGLMEWNMKNGVVFSGAKDGVGIKWFYTCSM